MAVFVLVNMRIHIGNNDLALDAYSHSVEVDVAMPTFACCNCIFPHHPWGNFSCLPQKFANSIAFIPANLIL